MIIIITVGIIVLITVLYQLIRSVVYTEAERNGEDLFISENDIYEQVRLSISSGNHGVAQKLAKKYLRENPKHERLRIILARSYYDSGMLSDAIEQLEILAKSSPERTDLLTMLADAYRRAGHNNHAIDVYLELLDANPDSVEILVMLAELYSTVNHKKSALNVYKRLLNFDISTREKTNYYYQIAQIYKDLGEYESAIEYVSTGLDKESGNIKLLYLLKDLYGCINDTQKEIEVMNKLLVFAPTDAYLQLDLVNLYYKSGKYSEALDIAIPSLQTPNADIQSLQNIIANIYIKTNKIEDSINVLESILNDYPQSIRLTETLAYAYRIYGRYEDAVELYEKLINWSDIKQAKIYNNQLSSTYCDWAMNFYNTGNTTETFAKFEEALRLNPENPEIYEGLGHVNFIAKNYPDAIRQMQKAIDLNPKNAEFYIFLGDIYYETDNFYEAEKMYKEAIFIEPDNSISRAKLGTIKVKNKDIQSALEHLSIAVQLDTKNWDYIYNLALAYELAGDINRAIKSYQKVLELNPEHKEAAQNLKMIENSK